ncbi:MAG: ISNCY family transposase [Thermoproteota archaeon]
MDIEERLNMGMKERDRLHAVRNVLEGRITQSEAARLLHRSERQVRRLCAKVHAQGERGLIHGLQGRLSNHCLDEELLGQALSALHDPLWEGFGPVFAREKLEQIYSLELGKTTVRKLMIGTQLWEVSRRGKRHRSWRERRPRAGMMVQLDGSPHDWLEGRGPRCTLIIYIDDADSCVSYGEFVDEEDTFNLMRTTKTYLLQRGRPGTFYVDKDSIYNVNRPANVEEQLEDKDPITQFTRAMGELGIEVLLAGSPQAKGRVERGFRTHQDRLVKELRLAGISTMKDANQFLHEAYIPDHNRRCAVEAAEPIDMHRPLLTSHDLDAILSHQEDRQVHNDSIVRYDNRFLLLAEGHGLRPKTKVVVQERLDGTLRIARYGRYFEFKQVQARPYVPEQLRRAKPRPVVVTRPKLPRNPFFGGQSVCTRPINAPASAVLS